MAARTARRLLGIVTIGQTPRPDLAATFGAAAPNADVCLAGALDGLSAAEVSALAVAGPYPLLVRLADGTTAEIPRDTLVPRVAAAAQTLADQGVALVVVACAGEFPAIACAVPVLVPGRVVPATVRAVAAGALVGIVTPNAAQVPFAEAKWRADGFAVTVTHASPAHHDDIARAAAAMRHADVALVVLDCMGHDEAYRAEFASLSLRPTLAVQTLIANLAGAMV
ncbi:MAG: AroM family protein [Acidobacteria bacterium]|nr:AroM family protein [Acidobacteriota bacterium]